uniref:Argonaute protein hrde-1/Nuclear RNAi defective-3 protein-like N-terminal domain-containing protein n=1 Tax=Caenorhabditis tropicalis TaxID=1561998 RepID=A0A1I7TC26_9PELO
MSSSGTDILKYTYDCATTIYAIDGAYKGGSDEETLRKEDFSEEEWTEKRFQTSRLSYSSHLRHQFIFIS